MSVTDPKTFSLIFSTATTKLKEWYDENPRGAVAFELRLTATEPVLQKARHSLQELYDGGDSCEFVKKLHVTIRFTHSSSGQTEVLDFIPA